jgi:hypothetical protein
MPTASVLINTRVHALKLDENWHTQGYVIEAEIT